MDTRPTRAAAASPGSAIGPTASGATAFLELSLPSTARQEPGLPGAGVGQAFAGGPCGTRLRPHTSGQSHCHGMLCELRSRWGHKLPARAPGLPSVSPRPDKGEVGKGWAGQGTAVAEVQGHSAVWTAASRVHTQAWGRGGKGGGEAFWTEGTVAAEAKVRPCEGALERGVGRKASDSPGLCPAGL